MKSILILCLTVALFSCKTQKLAIPGQKYSTGHMGMPGEYVFVFKDNNSFFYYESLDYSEGTFVWISKNRIKFTSKVMGFDNPHKEDRWFRDLTNKEATFKGKKLIYSGLILWPVKE